MHVLVRGRGGCAGRGKRGGGGGAHVLVRGRGGEYMKDVQGGGEYTEDVPGPGGGGFLVC